MEAGEQDLEADSQAPTSLATLAFVGGILLLFLAFREWITWASERGGLVSVVTAFRAAADRAPVIDVDRDGFQWPIVMVAIVIMLGVCGALKLNIGTHARALLPSLIAIGGGFVVSGMIGEPSIARYMTAHGYVRCPRADHHDDTRRGQPWFEDYVSSPARCGG